MKKIFTKGLAALAKEFTDNQEILYMPSGDVLEWNGTDWVKTGEHSRNPDEVRDSLLRFVVDTLLDSAQVDSNHAACLNSHRGDIHNLYSRINDAEYNLRYHSHKSSVGRSWHQ